MNDNTQVVGVADVTTVDPTSPSGAPEQHAVRWIGARATDLGTLGGPDSYANAINNRGYIVGGRPLARRWTPSSTSPISMPPSWSGQGVADLGTLGGTASGAYGINQWSQVVGVAWLLNNAAFHPALWSRGAIHDLGTVAGDTYGAANSINNLGQAVGGTGNASGPLHAYISGKAAR